MSVHSRRAVVATTIFAVTLLLAAAAGVASFLRSASEHELAAEQGRGADLRFQLVHAAAGPAEEQAGTAAGQWRLAERSDVAGTMQRIQALADATGAVLDEVKAVPSQTAGKQSFLLGGHGTPHEVCCLLAAIEKQEVLLVVESGRVVPGTGEHVVFELGLGAWHHEGER